MTILRATPSSAATTDPFIRVAATLTGLPVSNVWRGHGSALFLEFGKLGPAEKRPDGSLCNRKGEKTLMIEWSWRIEGPRSILAGSWSDETKWPAAFAKLRDAKVTGIALFGRLPEIDLALSSGHHVVSFSTTGGQPQWSLLDNDASAWFRVKNGKVVQETAAGRNP